jgi:hypothetical protein
MTSSMMRTRWLIALQGYPDVPDDQLRPFDIGFRGLRHWLKGDILPPYGAPRRFACVLASAWLAVTIALLGTGHRTAGMVLGWTMVSIASVLVVTGLCLPSLSYRKMTGTMLPFPPRSTG